MFLPKRKIIAVLLIFCFLLFIFFLSSRQATYSFRTISSDISKIPFYIVTAVSGEVRAILFFHRDYWDNLRLLRDNERLKQELLRLNDVTLENERLRVLLELRQGLAYETVAAVVLGKDFDSFRPYLLLDKGKANGAKKFDPVITSSGLIGKILELGRFSSKVILINDPDLSVPAVVSRTQEHGLISGTLDGRCKLRFLDLDSEVEQGDLVVTSGLNMTYPKGILIGKVKIIGVESSGLGKFAIIEPAVKISSVSEALIIKN